MASDLMKLLGYDESDPEVRAAKEDAAAHADVVDRLVRVREDRQLTQSDVADAMGTTQSTVSNFERLGSDPKLSTLMRYARAVGAKLRHSVVIDGGPESIVHAPSEITAHVAPSSASNTPQSFPWYVAVQGVDPGPAAAHG